MKRLVQLFITAILRFFIFQAQPTHSKTGWLQTWKPPVHYYDDFINFDTMANYAGQGVISFLTSGEHFKGEYNYQPWGSDSPKSQKIGKGFENCQTPIDSKTSGEIFFLCDTVDGVALVKVMQEQTLNDIWIDGRLKLGKDMNCFGVSHHARSDSIQVLCRVSIPPSTSSSEFQLSDEIIRKSSGQIEENEEKGHELKIFLISRKAWKNIGNLTISQTKEQDIKLDANIYSLDATIDGSPGAKIVILTKNLTTPKGWLVTLNSKLELAEKTALIKDNLNLPKNFVSLQSGAKSMYMVTKQASKITENATGTDYFVQFCNINYKYSLVCEKKLPVYTDPDNEATIQFFIRENFNSNDQTQLIITSDSFVLAGTVSESGFKKVIPKTLSDGRNKNIKTAYLAHHRVYAFGDFNGVWVMTLIDTRSKGQANIAMDNIFIQGDIVITITYTDQNYLRFFVVFLHPETKEQTIQWSALRDPYIKTSETYGEVDFTLGAYLYGDKDDENKETNLIGFADPADGAKIFNTVETKQTTYTGSVNYWPTSMNMQEGNGAFLSLKKGPDPQPRESSQNLLKIMSVANEDKSTVILTDQSAVELKMEPDVAKFHFKGQNLFYIGKNYFIDNNVGLNKKITMVHCNQKEISDFAPTCKMVFSPIDTGYADGDKNAKIFVGKLISRDRAIIGINRDVFNSKNNTYTSASEIRVINLKDGTQTIYKLTPSVLYGDVKEVHSQGDTKILFYAFQVSVDQSGVARYSTKMGDIYHVALDSKKLPPAGELKLTQVIIKGLKYTILCGFNLEFFKAPNNNNFVLGSNCKLNDMAETEVPAFYEFKYLSFDKTNVLISDFVYYTNNIYKELGFCLTQSNIVIFSTSNKQSAKQLFKSYSKIPTSNRVFEIYHHDISRFLINPWLVSARCHGESNTFHAIVASTKKDKHLNIVKTEQFLLQLDASYLGKNNKKRVKGLIRLASLDQNIFNTIFIPKEDRLVKFTINPVNSTTNLGNEVKASDTYTAFNFNLKTPKIKIDNRKAKSKQTLTQDFYLNDLRGYYSNSTMKISNSYVDPILDPKLTLIKDKTMLEIKGNTNDQQRFILEDYFLFEGPIQSIKFKSSGQNGDTSNNTIIPRQSPTNGIFNTVKDKDIIKISTEGDLLMCQTTTGVHMYFAQNGKVLEAGDLTKGEVYAIGIDEQSNRYGFAVLKGDLI